MRIERFELSRESGRFTIPSEAEPFSVVLDPGTWMLMEPPEFARRE
jgi:hypothetical protein